jgi:hypothetical protein
MVNRLRQLLYQQLLSNSGLIDVDAAIDLTLAARLGTFAEYARAIARCGALLAVGGAKWLRRYGGGLGGDRVSQLRRSGTWPVVVNSSAAGRFTRSPIELVRDEGESWWLVRGGSFGLTGAVLSPTSWHAGRMGAC